MFRNLPIYCLVLVLILSCSQRPVDHPGNLPDSVSYAIKYARGFTVHDYGYYKRVEVKYPYKGAKSGYEYLLVQKGESVPPHDPGTPVITIPLETIVCTSTTHIPLLDYLGETDKLVGFPTTDYISSRKMRKRIDAGHVRELGIDKGMNIEMLATLHPSMVMGYAMTRDVGQLKKIQELGIPVVINAEYLERHPLGRAEWIKFMALFFNKEKEADSIFHSIESAYLTTRDLASRAAGKPAVMSGIVYGDTWFLPGGQNYAARLLEDAGGQYLWQQDSTSGFLELSFESVYEKAHDADDWIGVGSYKSLEEIKAADQRYAKFKPFQTGNVYTYNARMGEKGGSEFLELGYLRPDLILQDLVKILHPEMLPDHHLYFHEQLR